MGEVVNFKLQATKNIGFSKKMQYAPQSFPVQRREYATLLSAKTYNNFLSFTDSIYLTNW